MAEGPSAIVLGLFDTGLGAARSLGRSGLKVLGLDPDRRMPGFASRFCESAVCPEPVTNPDGVVEQLLRLRGTLESPVVLFPSSDAFVLLVSRRRNSLREGFLMALPDAGIVEATLDKRRQYEMAAATGTPFPATYWPQTVEDGSRIGREVAFPALIKPCRGHLWRERFGGNHKGFRVDNAGQLEERLGEVLPTGLDVVVQAVIPGPNTNHFKVCAYIDERGEALAIFTLRKIRQYPTDFGVGTLVESIHYPELVELGLKFLRGIGYRGIGSAEFKRDERDGALKLIELNPRLWQQNILATDCGINFPLIQYLDLTGQHPKPQTEFKEGVRWFDAMADFQAFWSYFRRGELSIGAWVRSWIGARSFATFALDDLRPFLRANEYGLKYLRAPRYAMRHRS